MGSSEGNFIQCKQLICDTALPWNSSTVVQHSCENSTSVEQLSCDIALLLRGPMARSILQLGSSALLLADLLSSGLLCSGETSSVFLLQTGKGHILCRGKKCKPRARRNLTYLPKSPPLAPDWSFFIQMTPSSCSLVGPKGTALVIQNRAALIGW